MSVKERQLSTNTLNISLMSENYILKLSKIYHNNFHTILFISSPMYITSIEKIKANKNMLEYVVNIFSKVFWLVSSFELVKYDIAFELHRLFHIGLFQTIFIIVEGCTTFTVKYENYFRYIIKKRSNFIAKFNTIKRKQLINLCL